MAAASETPVPEPTVRLPLTTPEPVPEPEPDVIVVGAGLAGLAAARHLTAAGLAVVVLDAADRIGGRLHAERIDGFRLDHGVYLPTAEGLRAELAALGTLPGADALELVPLGRQLTVHREGRRHAYDARTPLPGRGDRPIRPDRPARTTDAAAARGPRLIRAARPALPARPRDALGEGARAWERARLNVWWNRLAATAEVQLTARPETDAARAAARAGLPSGAAEGFLRPLLTALLADPGLDATSSHAADLVLRDFALGGLALPAAGPGAIPAALAAALPAGTVRLGMRVTAVAADGVRTERHGRLSARAVVVATDADSAAALLPGLHQPRHLPATTFFHAADASPASGGAPLLLDASGTGGVAHTLVVSDVLPTAAPRGAALIATTVLGGTADGPTERAAAEPAVRRRLAELWGRPTDGWRYLTVRHLAAAVPATPVPHVPHRPVRVLHGLYVCGDHRDTGPLRAAMASGRRAATAVLRDLGFASERAA